MVQQALESAGQTPYPGGRCVRRRRRGIHECLLHVHLDDRPHLPFTGMTPTTSLNGVPLVAAITNAGYYAELAGGGLSRPHIFRETLAALLSR